MTDPARGRHRTTADAPPGFTRKPPDVMLAEIDLALAEHADSLQPRPARATFSTTVRPRGAA